MRVYKAIGNNNTAYQADSTYNDSYNYIGFYGKQSVFSNFYPTRLIYKSALLDSDGKSIQPRHEINYYFKTSEHLFHWMKAMCNPIPNKCYMESAICPPDGFVCRNIRTASTPGQSKYIGRTQVKITDESWSLATKIKAMRDIISLKFPLVSPDDKHMPSFWNPITVYPFHNADNIPPSVQLICTGSSHLIELSPFDSTWGVGKSVQQFDLFLLTKISKTMSVSMLLKQINAIPIDENHNDNHRKVPGLGLNLLGRLLMERRAKLQEEYRLSLVANNSIYNITD